MPGKVTWWTWPGVAGAPRVAKISPEVDAILIELEGVAAQRVEITREVTKNRTSFVCPVCERTCRHLHANAGHWACRLCCGLGYLSRSPGARNDAAARLARIDRKLAANRSEHDRLMHARIEAEVAVARGIARRTARLRREIEHAEAGADRAGPRGHLDAG